MNSESNAERFIVAFATIERCLNAITKPPKYVPFRTNARVAARYNAVISNHLDELCSYAELRNCIVHVRDDQREIQAQPTDAVTANIERIADLLTKDHSVMNYVTSPVIVARGGEKLTDALKRMDDHGIQKLPVYSQGKFLGLLTLQWVVHQMLGSGYNPESPVAECMDDSTKETVMFLDQSAKLEQVIKLFSDFTALKLGAPVLLVTEHGDHDEDPLGIITQHDLARIISHLA